MACPNVAKDLSQSGQRGWWFGGHGHTASLWSGLGWSQISCLNCWTNLDINGFMAIAISYPCENAFAQIIHFIMSSVVFATHVSCKELSCAVLLVESQFFSAGQASCQPVDASVLLTVCGIWKGKRWKKLLNWGEAWSTTKVRNFGHGFSGKTAVDASEILRSPGSW